MNKLLKATLFFVTICVQSLSGFEIGDIPLQDEGRIKPLDTFARNHLLAFYVKRSIKELDMGATDWIITSFLTQKMAGTKKYLISVIQKLHLACFSIGQTNINIVLTKLHQVLANNHLCSK